MTSLRGGLPIPAATLALSLAALLTGCGRSGPGLAVEAQTNNAPASREVRVWKVEPQPHERLVKASGSLAAYEQATLSTKVAGRLQSIVVDLGSIVRKGEVIARLEQSDYILRVRQSEALFGQARVRLGLSLEGSDDTVDPDKTGVVRQTKAVLDEAKATLDRLNELTRQGIVSKSELETVESNYRVALSKHQDALEEIKTRQSLLAQRRAELEIARQDLTETTILAPFDCAIQDRKADQGEYLIVGAPVATVVRLNPVRLKLDVPERESARVRRGQKVRLTLEGVELVYDGVVERLSPVIDEQTRVLRVEADVPNPGNLRPGAFARAEIVVEDGAPVIVVPREALVLFAGIEKVFVIQDGKAAERLVNSGRVWKDSIEIVKGLKPGELVVLTPAGLRAGDPLRAAK